MPRTPRSTTKRARSASAKDAGSKFGAGLGCLVALGPQLMLLPIYMIKSGFTASREWRRLRKAGRVLPLADAIDRATSGRGTLLVRRAFPYGIARLLWVEAARNLIDPEDELCSYGSDELEKKLASRATRHRLGQAESTAFHVDMKEADRRELADQIVGMPAIELHGAMPLPPDPLSTLTGDPVLDKLRVEREEILRLLDEVVGSAEYERAKLLHEQARVLERRIKAGLTNPAAQ